MKRRAELEEQTRRRITESTVELHGTVGPARTTVTAVAERAGVRRSTVYRHFPDEAALFAACSAHWRAANPPPDLERWAAIPDPEDRLRAALTEQYGYYRATEGMIANLLRDSATVPIVDQLLGRYRGRLEAARDVLMAGRGLRGGARRRARRDRPRARVRDVALARARAGPRRRRGRADDGPAGRCGLTRGLLPPLPYGLPYPSVGAIPGAIRGLARCSRDGPDATLPAMKTNQTEALRELDHRVSDGIEVQLLWRESDNRALVAVSDAKTGEAFTLEVGRDQRALDVFHHPFAYAGNRRSTRDENSGELAQVSGS